MSSSSSTHKMPSPLGLSLSKATQNTPPSSLAKQFVALKTRPIPRRFPKKRTLREKTLYRNAIKRLRNDAVGITKRPNVASNKVKNQLMEGLAFSDTLRACGNRQSRNFASDGASGSGCPVVRDDVLDPLAANEPLPTNHKIMVKSRQRNDMGVFYEIRDEETFEAIYEDYASRVDVSPYAITLEKNGVAIPQEATALAMRIRTGDIIIVYGRSPNANMNSRVKAFYIRNTCTPYHEVKVCAKLTSKLTRLFQKWAAKVNLDPKIIRMQHQDKKLNRRFTIGESGIKNQDYVYAFPD